MQVHEIEKAISEIISPYRPFRRNLRKNFHKTKKWGKNRNAKIEDLV
jgi:hypothetical protein